MQGEGLTVRDLVNRFLTTKRHLVDTREITPRTFADYLEQHLHRPGIGFYTLRHVMETVGGESKDQPAVDHVMGHARDDMASVDRERISDARLVAVAEHIRRWLFGSRRSGAK